MFQDFQWKEGSILLKEAVFSIDYKTTKLYKSSNSVNTHLMIDRYHPRNLNSKEFF
jgi:hypothetical protein